MGGGVTAEGTAARSTWAISGIGADDPGDAASWVTRGSSADAPVAAGGVVGAFWTPGTLSAGVGVVPGAGRGGS